MSETGTTRAIGFRLLGWFALGIGLFVGCLALLWCAGSPGFNPAKALAISNQVGTGLDVRLSYEAGSHGVSTFFVHVKNTTERPLALLARMRDVAGDRNISERNEGSFQLCLVKPWGRVPLNSYTTRAINDGIAGPIQPGQEMTFEYNMVPGDVGRIGQSKITACVSYYDADPSKPWGLPAGQTPPLLAAWSNVMEVEPTPWGPVMNGLQVGLTIQDDTATVQARNVSSQPLQILPPEDLDSSDRKAFYLFIVLQYSGLSALLHPEQIPTRRFKHDPQILNPGEVISSPYALSPDDLRAIGGNLLVARVHFTSPERLHGPAADSNAVSPRAP